VTGGARCSVVIATRNRRGTLVATLAALQSAHSGVPIIVVDNASSDGTPAAVREAFPGVDVIALDANHGAAARNLGVAHSRTAYVAFNDDDTYWSAGSLEPACALLDAHPRVAAVCASVRVGPGAALDRACRLMETSPLPKRTACPGVPIASFLAGATVVRRDAFLDAGGFHPRFLIGAEEALLALDLMAAGWELVYDERLVVHHDPCSVSRDPCMRRRLVTRNRLWVTWLRRSFPAAFAYTARVGARALRDRDVRRAAAEAFFGLPWVLRERRPVPRSVERRYAAVREL
jgi:N-acetylglucosaminyl-diphospho-decaprenol L-rhamnosyltransferase